MDGGTSGPVRPRRLRFGIGAGLSAAGHGLALCALTPSGVILLVFLAFPIGAGPRPGPGFVLLASLFLATLAIGGLTLATLLIPEAPPTVRRLASLHRRLISDWCGVPIADPYLTRPRRADVEGSVEERFERLLNDPVARRDLLWLSAGSWVALVLAAAPAGLIGYGVIGFGAQLSGTRGPGLSTPAEIGAVVVGLAAGPWLLRAYGGFARLMLAPTGQAELELRARHLAQTRSEAIDSGAAEIRRIERDLHDGAQARLVAMGMTLSAADELMDDNPAAARALLASARDSSAQALADLRNLVRGIHPPVLADRGLADAVAALALDSPLRVHLASDLPGRLPAPVESAAYFAVSELLANVTKHAAATQAWVDIRHLDAALRIGVTDDGAGGADPGRGSGLRGIERRLAAFDGVLAITSPPGGPTAVTMEIGCALSSPKTSSC